MLLNWTAGIPVLGSVVEWIKEGVCWTITQPPDLVVDSAKAICGTVFGACS